MKTDRRMLTEGVYQHRQIYEQWTDVGEDVRKREMYSRRGNRKWKSSLLVWFTICVQTDTPADQLHEMTLLKHWHQQECQLCSDAKISVHTTLFPPSTTEHSSQGRKRVKMSVCWESDWNHLENVKITKTRSCLCAFNRVWEYQVHGMPAGSCE